MSYMNFDWLYESVGGTDYVYLKGTDDLGTRVLQLCDAFGSTTNPVGTIWWKVQTCTFLIEPGTSHTGLAPVLMVCYKTNTKAEFRPPWRDTWKGASGLAGELQYGYWANSIHYGYWTYPTPPGGSPEDNLGIVFFMNDGYQCFTFGNYWD